MDILSDLGRKLDQYSDKLNAFADFIVSNEKLPSRFKENLFHAPTKGDISLLIVFVIILHRFPYYCEIYFRGIGESR